LGSELKDISLVELRGPLPRQAQMNHPFLLSFLIKLLGTILLGISPADIQIPGQMKLTGQTTYSWMQCPMSLPLIQFRIPADNSFTANPKCTSSLSECWSTLGLCAGSCQRGFTHSDSPGKEPVL